MHDQTFAQFPINCPFNKICAIWLAVTLWQKFLSEGTSHFFFHIIAHSLLIAFILVVIAQSMQHTPKSWITKMRGFHCITGKKNHHFCQFCHSLEHGGYHLPFFPHSWALFHQTAHDKVSMIYLHAISVVLCIISHHFWGCRGVEQCQAAAKHHNRCLCSHHIVWIWRRIINRNHPMCQREILSPLSNTTVYRWYNKFQSLSLYLLQQGEQWNREEAREKEEQ